MGWLTPRAKSLPSLDREVLKKEFFDFPPEVPAVGQLVGAVHFKNDQGDITRLEATVINRESGPKSVDIRVSDLFWGHRIGTQDLKFFRWNLISKEWSFWNDYDEKFVPAVLKF